MSNKTKRKGSTPSDLSKQDLSTQMHLQKAVTSRPSKKGAEGSAAHKAFTVPSGPRGKEKLVLRVTSLSEKGSAARTEIGFVLMDSEQRRIYFNAEAARILAYPARARRGKHLELLLANKIRTILPQHKGNSRPDFRTEFLSGRRRYLCRAFSLPVRPGTPQTNTGLLLERMILGRLPAPGIAKQFCLTPRELETAGLLVLGLTNKEIAARMSISPNTVKNFLRLIMFKTGASSRSGIVGKILGLYEGHARPERRIGNTESQPGGPMITH